MKDNHLCVAGEKSKLLIIGTKQLKESKASAELKINVDNKEITETSSEKLLGLVINNELTWKNHLYGDKDNQGLIPKLSKRVGMLQRLSKFMPKQRLKNFASGLFYSVMSYCLPVFGNVFGLATYKEKNSRYSSFTVNNNHQLQVLQNKVNRLLIGAEYNTPTADLIRDTDSLSVQQMIAYQTAVAVHKITRANKPTYLANKMKIKTQNMHLRGRLGSIGQPEHSLSIAREGFIFRGVQMFNKLDEVLKNEPKWRILKLELESGSKIKFQ